MSHRTDTLENNVIPGTITIVPGATVDLGDGSIEVAGSVYTDIISSNTVNNGINIEQNIHKNGVLTITGTTDASSSTTGSLIVSGGIGLSKKLTINTSTQDYSLTGNNDIFYLQGLKAATNAAYSFFNSTGDNSIDTLIKIYGKGTPLSLTNTESLYLGTTSGTDYVIKTLFTGTGTARSLILSTAGNLNQIVLQTDNTVSLSGTTASTSNTTGTLKLVGGIGISNTTDAVSSTNGGTFTSAGGGAFAKSVYIGGLTTALAGLTSTVGTTTLGTTNVSGVLASSNTTASTSNTTGAVTLAGGIGISNTTDAVSSTNGGTFTSAGGGAFAKSVYIGGLTTALAGLTSTVGTTTLGTTNVSGILASSNTTASTSNTTGAVTLAGGIGISNTTDAVSSTNGGTFTSAGGGAFAKSVYIGINTNVAGQYIGVGRMITTTGTASHRYFSAAGGAVRASFSLRNTIVTDGGQDFGISRWNDATVEILSLDIKRLTGDVSIYSTSASTSNSTGSLIISGGLGISNTTDAVSSTNGGTFTSAGGGAFAKYVFIGGLTTLLAGLTSTAGTTTLGTTNVSGILASSNTTASTSNTTGAVTLAGGIGISNTTDAVSSTNGGTFTSAGGGAFAKSVYIGGLTTLLAGLTSTAGTTTLGTTNVSGILASSNTTASTSNTTGAVTLSGGIGISNTTNAVSSTNGGTFTSAGGGAFAKALFIGGLTTALAGLTSTAGTTTLGTTNVSGILASSNTTASTSNTTGAVTLAGGIGINNTTDAVSSTNGGTFTSAGGGAFAKSVFIGTQLITGGPYSGPPQQTTGAFFNVNGTTFTDNTTAASGTAIRWQSIRISAPTLAASNLNVTTTDAITVHIEGPPVAGSNQTFTNSYALKVKSGIVRIDDTTDASASNAGSIQTAGGIAVGKSINMWRITAPSAPTAGITLYIDTADLLLKSKNTSGTVSTYQPCFFNGDINSHDGTNNVRFPIGTNGNVLTVNTGMSCSMEWVVPFGAEYQYHNDYTSSSTTSNTYQTKNTLTTTSLIGGTYQIHIAAKIETSALLGATGGSRWRIDTNSQTTVVNNLANNNVDVMFTDAKAWPFTAGVHTIDIQWNSSSALTTITISETKITLFRVGN